MLSRRSFIQAGLCAGASTSVLSNYPFTVHAADTSDYKALVTIWLGGGMDGHDVVIPLAPASHSIIKAARPGIYAEHEAGGSSREIANLLRLSDTNRAAHNGQQFGLAPELTDLHRYYEQGDMAVIGSVGPLLEPLNRARFDRNGTLRPIRLFSHNDQALTWMTFGVEGATHGWGGAFANAFYRRVPKMSANFLGIHLGASQAFLHGRDVRPFSLGGRGVVPDEAGERLDRLMREGNRDKIKEILEVFNAHGASDSMNASNYYTRDVIASNNRSLELSRFYRDAISEAPAFDVPFPTNQLGQQLEAVAGAIAIRKRIGAPRQIFSTTLGRWDTHSAQAENLSKRLTMVNDAIAAFRAAMVQLGVWDDVTVFTGAEFGRSLVENGSGTDHGWGGHQFVLGGSVKGKQITGRMPINWNYKDKSDKGEFVSGRGSLIPSTSVEQYAAALGEWFGLTPAELNGALPNLGSFPAGPLDLFT